MQKILTFILSVCFFVFAIKCNSDASDPNKIPEETKEEEIIVSPFRHNPPKNLENLWDSAEIKPSQVFRIDKSIGLYLENKDRYKKIQNMRVGGVPAAVVFVLHGRESTWNWGKHLHEGSPLTGKTKWVPKGRPKFPPANGHTYTFEESAEDALYKLKDLESKDWTKCYDSLDQIERYNGLGYRFRDLNSPYLWNGTYHYQRGKFVSDGVFDSDFVDKQLGTATILLRMVDRDIDIGFR